MTHILCHRCGQWQGNVAADTPIGWLELYDDTGGLVGWFWDHDCGRIVIEIDELSELLERRRVRRYPTPIS
jgi:hypothetical protein